MRKSLLSILSVLLVAPGVHAKDEKKKKKPTPVWTSTSEASLPADYGFQGEYASEELGAQVIALGTGTFQVVLYTGGLPGAGWNGSDRSLMHGVLKGDKAVVLSPAEGKRKYLGAHPGEFSATAAFPPEGHQACTGLITGDLLTGNMPDGSSFALKNVLRKSETLGRSAPAGAVVLFDGSHTDHFQGGRLDEKTKWLNTDGKDIRTKEKYNNYTMHVEFMMPYRPAARGQGRGNSGFYQVGHYEVQILDSFGLEGENNECGGIYKNAKPKVNMCYPPLTWQTYDIEFTNAVVENDNKTKKATVTLRHNGVLIHDQVEVQGPTGGHRKDPEGTPGPIKFQGHGNPVQFRNIWIKAN